MGGTFAVSLAITVMVQIYCVAEMKESAGLNKEQIAVLFCKSYHIPKEKTNKEKFLE